MAKANVIVVGAIVLAPAIVAVEGYAIYRTHHRAPRSAESGRGEPLAAELPAPPLPVTETPTPPPARQPVAPREAPATTPAPASEATGAAVDPVVDRRQRSLYQRRGQVIHDADEQVFDALNVPDAQRVAIRAIDETYAQALESMAQAGHTFWSAPVDDNAEQTRRTAIAGVLGPETSRAFNFAERKAERRVRNQLRPEVVRGY